MNSEEWKKYCKQVGESEGFEVGEFPTLNGFMDIVSHDFENYPMELAKYTRIAIRGYNYREKTNLEFVEIVNVTCQLACAYYYITFKAKDSTTGKIDTYQTMMTPLYGGSVEFMRRKPSTKPEGPSRIRVREQDVEEEKKRKET